MPDKEMDESMQQGNLTLKIDAIKTTSEVIAQSIKEMIFQAEFKPGQQLVQENLARMFGVSRVPVRDALQVLITMGLAVNVPRHGVIVRPLSRKLLDELFEVRKVLEGAAIKMAVQKVTPDLLKTLEKLIREQSQARKIIDVKQNEKIDDAFHRTLYNAIGNDTLIDLIFANWDRIKQARSASTVELEHGTLWIEKSIQRHIRLVDALGKKRTSIAYNTTIENIENSQQEITSCLEELGWIEEAS
jgi:DNA-binding GntR family transcriptional regulator